MTAINKDNFIFLDRNENQYGPAPACLKVLRNSENLLNTYSRDFTRGIKSVLSERLACDFGTEEKKILLGYGSEDILKQVVQCYTGKGNKIMIPSCSWWYYKKLAEEAGGVNIQYPIVEGADSFFYDIRAMIKLYREHRPELVLISSPNNPTGNMIDQGELDIVLEEMKGTLVILDEAYCQFSEKTTNNPVTLVNRFPNLMIIRTFSKFYSLAGIRTGFAFIGENHKKFSLLNARYLGFNRLSEMLAIAALDSTGYYNSIRDSMAADMEMLYTELNSLPYFKAYRSYANFMLVKIPSEIKDSLKRYLDDAKVIVKFMNEDGLDSHIRITLGTHPQNRVLLNLIRTFVHKKIRYELVAGV
jgi:histidinol-phosphate aminotransferase